MPPCRQVRLLIRPCLLRIFFWFSRSVGDLEETATNVDTFSEFLCLLVPLLGLCKDLEEKASKGFEAQLLLWASRGVSPVVFFV